jgi:hypothetical protein
MKHLRWILPLTVLSVTAPSFSHAQAEFSECQRRHLANAIAQQSGRPVEFPEPITPFAPLTHADALRQPLVHNPVEPSYLLASAVPTDDSGFRRVFNSKRDRTLAERDQIARFEQNLDQLRGGSGSIAPFHINGVADYAALLTDSDVSFLVIIGHNRGGTFYFPDGTYGSLQAMGLAAVQYHKRVIFVSCEASRFVSGNVIAGPAHEINLDEAISISRRLQRHFEEAADRSTPAPQAEKSGKGATNTGNDGNSGNGGNNGNGGNSGNGGSRGNGGRGWTSFEEALGSAQFTIDDAGQSQTRARALFIVCTAGAVGGALVILASDDQ